MNRFKFFVTQLLAVTLLTAPLAVAPVSAQTPAPAKILYPTDRTILPIPEPKVPNSTVFNARNATAPERFEVKAPAGAPNVLIVLIDDMGFGMSEAFGGPIHMPTATRLALRRSRRMRRRRSAPCSTRSMPSSRRTASHGSWATRSAPSIRTC